MRISSQLYSTCKIKSIRRSGNQQNTELDYPTHMLPGSQKRGQKNASFLPSPRNTVWPLVHNPQLVLQSHVRNKTECFDTVFTRLLLGFSEKESEIQDFSFTLHCWSYWKLFYWCTRALLQHLNLPALSDCIRICHFWRSLPFPWIKWVTLQTPLSVVIPKFLWNYQIIHYVFQGILKS